MARTHTLDLLPVIGPSFVEPPGTPCAFWLYKEIIYEIASVVERMVKKKTEPILEFWFRLQVDVYSTSFFSSSETMCRARRKRLSFALISKLRSPPPASRSRLDFFFTDLPP